MNIRTSTSVRHSHTWVFSVCVCLCLLRRCSGTEGCCRFGLAMKYYVPHFTRGAIIYTPPFAYHASCGSGGGVSGGGDDGSCFVTNWRELLLLWRLVKRAPVMIVAYMRHCDGVLGFRKVLHNERKKKSLDGHLSSCLMLPITESWHDLFPSLRFL